MVYTLIREKVRVLEDTFKTIESATKDHALMKFKRSNVGPFQDAFAKVCLLAVMTELTVLYTAVFSRISCKRFQ